MEATIHCFLPYSDLEQVRNSVVNLRQSTLASKITLLATDSAAEPCLGCDIIYIDSLTSSATMRAIAEAADADYILLYTGHNTLEPGYLALHRFARISADSGAAMTYADHYTVVDGKRSKAPVIDYQEGSLRDDFSFGSVLFFDTVAFKRAAADFEADYKAAGLYDLRLRLSRIAPVMHINEYLYSDVTTDSRASGEKIFDYVDPRNRASQIEMEQACTAHLKAIGAYLEPQFESISFDLGSFANEASVIIPVRNRVRTIRDAIRSVLSQKTDFPFNLIVIDNPSTDGTTEPIDEFA
ncbi:MAG: glycosyltransferase family 2 protein, partial [Muribaculaceae bacterium]|nr:glycosyltransferase family 2 protein [Muribaculaceae bacterium]